MAVGEFVSYARDFFRLDYPADWTVRENRPVGVITFVHPAADGDTYPAGIALIAVPETGIPLDTLLRTGLFLLTRDLRTPTVERRGEDQEGGLVWHRLLVRGRTLAPVSVEGDHLDVVKHVSLCRPGPGILALALYGTVENIAPLERAFEALRRSVRIVY